MQRFHSLLFLGIIALLAPFTRADASNAIVTITPRMAFSPKAIVVKVGGTVEWVNRSSIDHTVTADPSLAPGHVHLPAGATPFDSGRLSPGKTFQVTFTVPGVYDYVCLPHYRHGMVGKVIVIR